MASNGNDPTTGHPLFPATDAPDMGVDEEILAAYAAFRGTRMYGSNADMEALDSDGYARDGELWFNTTDGITYLYDSGWREWESDWITYSPTISGFTLTSGSFLIAKYKYEHGKITVKIRAAVASMTSNPQISLPKTASDSVVEHLDGSVALIPGAGSEALGVVRKVSATAVVFYYHWVPSGIVYAGNISSTVPITWGSTGTIAATFSYEHLV